MDYNREVPASDVPDKISEPLLSAEEEIELATIYQEGMAAQRTLDEAEESLSKEEKTEYEELVIKGKAAKDRFVTANSGLVFSIANRKKYADRGLDLQDLEQEGFTGLIRAVELFDPTKGFKFSTYATDWIQQAIERALAFKGSHFNIPLTIQRDYRTILFVMNQRGETMITQTVIKEAGVGKDVKYWERIKRQYLVHSLDKLTKVGTSIHDILPNEDTDVAEQATDLAVVERMLETLKAKGGDQGETMARIIARRYGLDYEEPATYTELAGQLGISRDTVKSLEKYALMLLRTITVI